jgi:hypothetical protein
LLVALNHEFVHDDDVAIGEGFGGLETEFHDGTPSLVDFDEATGARDAVDAAVKGGAGYFEVAEFDQLLILVL